MSRIRSQHGNVIAADFRPKATLDLTVTFTSETLFCDGRVLLHRTTAMLGDKTIAVIHHLGDMATGTVAQLNS